MEARAEAAAEGVKKELGLNPQVACPAGVVVSGIGGHWPAHTRGATAFAL